MSLAERKQKQPRILPGDLVCTEDFPETLGLVTLSSPGTRRNKSVCKVQRGQSDYGTLFREEELVLRSRTGYEDFK